MIYRKIVLTVLALVFGMASRSEALLMTAFTVNGVNACATDNNVLCSFGTQIQDLNPAIGVISYGPNPIIIGPLSISGSVQQSTIGGTQNILNTSSTQVTNLSGSTATGFFAVSQTDFTPPVSQAFISGTATWQNATGSGIVMSWYNDPFNDQGAQTATDTPGILLASCTDNITLIADGTACSQGGIPVTDLNPFSMTLATQFSLVAGGTLVNRGQTEIKPRDQVPEPASLALFGLALLGVGLKRRSQ